MPISPCKTTQKTFISTYVHIHYTTFMGGTRRNKEISLLVGGGGMRRWPKWLLSSGKAVNLSKLKYKGLAASAPVINKKHGGK